MTKTIDRMTQAGLVERRPDNSDRRKVRIYISVDGRRRVDAALADAKAHEREVLADYSPAETAQMKSMLRTLLERNGASSGGD